uniref:Uncharacterized protein n=1 Tax=Globisporangium ultimum (strain ATCC 200006 / CBS 805.95 / DAOM BR144) TaxID=431595 RepID=K3X9J5_GLOUD
MGLQLTSYTRAKLRLVLDVFLVVTLTAFDIRDLVYKISWLGPYDTFHFSATGNNFLEPQQLQLAVNLTTPGQELHRPNGWSSFFEKCPHMTAMGKGTFRMAIGHNCTVGTDEFKQTVPNLALAASARVDAVAWSCCQLLALKRQPSVCSAQLVRGFEDRYYLEIPNTPEAWIAKANSKEERELLELLDVIGESYPLNHITCVEAFDFRGVGEYHATIVGCGSPNVFRSAFAGTYATHLRDLHNDKAYLTMDKLNLMGLSYGIRENCISRFVAELTVTGQMYVAYTTIINFSTYGQLYAFQIINDFLLMVVNFLSALQVGSHLVLPAFRAKNAQAAENFLREGYSSFMTCTVYRSPMIGVMVVMSQLLAWFIILPNTVIWTWGSDSTAKVQAYLSSLRLWVFILILINITWDMFTFCNEKLAFKIAKHTFLAPAEIIAIGAIISYWNRFHIFGIGEKKYALESQRCFDATSFQGYTGAGNAYNPALDTQLNTPTAVLWVIYKPLFTVLGLSILAVCGYAALKFCVFYWTPARNHGRRSNYLVTVEQTTTASKKYSISKREGIILDDERSRTRSQPALKTNPSEDAATHRSLGTFIHFSESDRSFVPENSEQDQANARKRYARLPLESLLNTPIRARSLTRSSLDLDHIVNHERFVSPHLYLEFGIFFVGGRMKPRWGFLNPIPPIIQVDHTVISDMIQPLTPEQLLARLRSAAKKK